MIRIPIRWGFALTDSIKATPHNPSSASFGKIAL